MGDNSPGGIIALDQRLARVVARPLARLGVAPNALTALAMAVGLCAAVLLAMGTPVSYWGAGLFAVAVWMDHLDGEVARMTARTSNFGHYFDHAAAMVTYIGAFAGGGYGLRSGWLGDWAPYLGVAAGIAIAAIFSIRMWLEVRDGRESVQQPVRHGFEIEDTLYLVAPITWLGGLSYFILAAGIGAPLFLCYVIWDAWFRERRALP